MDILAQATLKHFYSVCGRVIGAGRSTSSTETGESKTVRTIHYHCMKCDAEFTIEHPYRKSGFYGPAICDDSYFTCPHCGAHFLSTANFSEVYLFRPAGTTWTSECIPREVTLIVKEIREGFILEAREKVTRMTTDNGFYHENRSEVFRFDVKHRRTTYTISYANNRHTYKLVQFELGAPFDLRIYEVTALRALNSNNLAFKEHNEYTNSTRPHAGVRSEVTTVLRVLRDGIRRKWKKFHGYDIGSLFASCGTSQGVLLFPLLNLAYRLICPDAKNLPHELREGAYEVDHFAKGHAITKDDKKKYADLGAFRRARNTTEAVIKLFKLPDLPSVRRVLVDDIFNAVMLKKAYELMHDENHARRLYQFATNGAGRRLEYGYYNAKPTHEGQVIYDYADMLLKAGWTESKVLRLLEAGQQAKAGKIVDFRDIRHMLTCMPTEIHQEAAKVRLRDLHDWLTWKKKELDEKGYPLKPPESVRRRLQMQITSDCMRFYLPTHTRELRAAGEELHNCVGGYGKRILQNMCNVVFMTDDSGKLLACLEVANGRLIQAKLKFNCPVSKDARANGAVIDWCEAAGIEIATYDVRELRLPMVIGENPEKVTA